MNSQKVKKETKRHAELDSASNKIKDLRDPEIVGPELDSGHG